MEALSEHVLRCVYKFFARSGSDSHAQSEIIKQEISASELRRKLIKSDCVVGWVCILEKAASPTGNTGMQN